MGVGNVIKKTGPSLSSRHNSSLICIQKFSNGHLFWEIPRADKAPPIRRLRCAKILPFLYGSTRGISRLPRSIEIVDKCLIRIIDKPTETTSSRIFNLGAYSI